MAHKTVKNCLYSSIIIAFLLIYQPAHAQYDFSKVNDWLSENVKDLGGRAVILVYKDGKMIYEQAENELNAKQKFVTRRIAKKTGRSASEMLKDFNGDTKLPIASCSKWLSAALVMTFVDEGKLKLNDSIGEFLPVMTANGKGNITIPQCLSHTTGIRPEPKENKALASEVASMDEAMRNIAAHQMEALPGEGFHYSSIGLQVAAAVIEKISGKDFETLFQEKIAVPCGMTNTDFGHKNVPLAAGGGQGTANDYIRFLQMILAKGLYKGKRVLQASSVALMQQNYTSGKKIISTPAEAGNWGYGLGEWMLEESATGKVANAVTSPGLFGSFPWVDNERKYVGILFCFNLKNKGRAEKYITLKKLVDEQLDK